MANFISTWNTENLSTGSSATKQVHLPLVSTGTYNFNVNWGDGLNDTITVYNQAQATHTYALAGVYTLTISGTLTGFQFNGAGDMLKLTLIRQFGILRLGNAGSYFKGTANLKITATDNLDLTGTTTLVSAFWQSGIDTVPSMNTWDVSNITAMPSMFYGATLFNQNISAWNMAKVTNCGNMFLGAISFNQPIGVWNLAVVTNLSNMFNGATAFNQNLGGWNATKLATCLGILLNSGISSTNYSNLLIGWSKQVVPHSLTLSTGPKYFTGAATTARAILTGPDAWTVTDGGSTKNPSDFLQLF